MQRTKFTSQNRIPDAINCSITREFTQIPNELLRNPNISHKAKSILCLLLSNREGWTSYIETIKKFSKEGDEAIRSGLSELEEHGYLLRVRYRDKQTKVWRGSFWAYTDIPNNFNMEGQIETVNEMGYEVAFGTENPQVENPDVDILEVEDQRLKIPIYKNTNNNKINIYLSDPDFPQMESNKKVKLNESNSSPKKTEEPPQKKPPIKERNGQYLPIAKRLAEIVKTSKNIKTPPEKLHAWTDPIRRLIESEEVDPVRIDTVLDWYADNIGGPYIPVIESGHSLRDKFIRLETAMKNNGYRDKPRSKPIQAISRPAGKQYPC